MVSENLSSIDDQINSILQDLDNDLYRLPETERGNLAGDLNRLKALWRARCQAFTERVQPPEPIPERDTLSSNQLAGEIIESITDAFYAVDANWRLTYVNQRAEAWWRRSRESLMGTVLWDMFPNYEETEGYKNHLHAMQARIPVHFETFSPNLHAWMDVHIYPASDGGLSTYFRDITERKQLEQALADSERKYRELVQYAPSAIYEVDFSLMKFTSVNDAMVAMSGYSREELLQMSPFDLLDEQSQILLRERTQRILAGEQPNKNVEYRVKTKDGTIKFAVLNTTFKNDETGRPGCATVIAHDITERKQAEEALKVSEEKFSQAFNSSPVALTITRLSDGRFVEVNESHYQISGYTRSEVIGRTGMELGLYIDAEERAKLDNLIREAGRIRNYETTIRTKTGDDLTILSSIEPIKLDGEACILSTMIDITDQKRAEQARQESEEAQRRSAMNERARANELEVLMDAAPAVIWISRDPDCREMIGNRYSYDFLRISQGENVSKTAPEEAVAVQQYRMEKDGRPVPLTELPMQIAAGTGKPAKDYEFDLVFQDGEVFHMFGNVNPLFDADGNPYGAIGVFVDLSAIRRLETQQIQSKAQIEVQRRLMEQREQERLVIARDLHDGPLQTLSSTIFHLQMVKEVFPDAALQIELSQIRMDIKNAIHEIREVLNDLRPPALMHFGLSRMIQIYTEDLRERFPEIQIQMDLMDDHQVLSDEARLALFRIYQAAINNIVRHSGAKQAWITFKMEEDSFQLQLTDNGKGFKHAGDFSQLTRNGHFGLIGMKERAEAIGGAFTVISEPGMGTTIRIKGPLSGRNIK